jgi:urocanate hydratase
MIRGCYTFTGAAEITMGMKDGSDGVADWVHLGAMLGAAVGVDYMATIGMGPVRVQRWFIVLDGTKETDERLDRAIGTDADLAITRWADAGYEEPRRMAKELGVRMLN